MADSDAPAREWTTIAIGVLTATIGVYYLLVGLGLAPAPPVRGGDANAPAWLGLLIGLIFFAGGVAVMLRGLTGADDKSGELPASAPTWTAAIYWLMGLLVAIGLAATATWVALGGGSRHFTMVGVISGSLGESIGRAAFGVGAIISWSIVAAMTYAGAKKLLGRRASP